MDLNQIEATRAKAIAEKKLSKKDFAGAQEFALKALELFPELEGIFQLLDIIGVYLANEKRFFGEIDWYGILGVDPSADYETMKRAYRRLAVSLHPDKNKSPAAEDAFKMLNEAWSLLSDKATRLEYDQRQSIRCKMQTGMEGFNSLGGSLSSAGNPSPSTRPPAMPTSTKPSFWTSCKRCSTYFEYLKIYLNEYISCAKCSHTYLATEVPAALADILKKSELWTYLQPQQDVCHPTITDVPESSRRKFSSAQSMGAPCLPQGGSASRMKIQFSSLSEPTSATKTSSDFESARSKTKKRHRDSFTIAVSEAASGSKSSGPKNKGYKLNVSGHKNQVAPERIAVPLDKKRIARASSSSSRLMGTPGLPQVGSTYRMKIQFSSLSEPTDAISDPNMVTLAAKTSSDVQSARQETEVKKAVGKAEKSANVERLVGVREEPHAFADEIVAEDSDTAVVVTNRFREPVVTYVRRRGKKAAVDKDTNGEVTHRFRGPVITYVRRKSGKKVSVDKIEAKEGTMSADA